MSSFGGWNHVGNAGQIVSLHAISTAGGFASLGLQFVGLTGFFAYRVKERALTHKYRVGETVYFTASNVSRPAASGTYEVIRLLPTDGDDCQYRIKSTTEAFERVAKESQLKAA
jgi:hypothetical protein